VSLVLFVVVFLIIFKWDLNYIFILTVVIFIHELGHYLAMKLFKYNDLNIFFIPLVGAVTSGDKDRISQKQNIITLLAGPLPGIIIGMFSYYFGIKFSNAFLIKASTILVFLNLFNLLPIIPLDGGKIIKSLYFDSNEIINKIFIILSIAVLIFFSLKLKTYVLLIIPYYLILQLVNQSQVYKVRFNVKLLDIDLEKSFDELTDREYWLIRDEIAKNIKAFNKIIGPKQYFISSKEAQIINQVKSVLLTKPIQDLNIFGKILISLIWILSFILSFIFVLIILLKSGVIK
jgi:stage IV sporulation protein FB